MQVEMTCQPQYQYLSNQTSDLLTTINEWGNMKITIEGENIKCSDGFHTFDELYEHRIVLFLALCGTIKTVYPIWMSEFHADGSNYDGWFIMGINTEKGKQISYHLPMRFYDQASGIAHTVLQRAPEWDGHTSDDVLKRISNL